MAEGDSQSANALVGQSPDVPKPTLESRPAAPGREALIVQRAVLDRQDLREALQPALAPSVIQTAVERQSEQAPAAAAPGRGETEEERQDESQDVDALARQVYQILRRRLAVERERERPYG
jgi:hypothetical protein